MGVRIASTITTGIISPIIISGQRLYHCILNFSAPNWSTYHQAQSCTACNNVSVCMPYGHTMRTVCTCTVCTCTVMYFVTVKCIVYGNVQCIGMYVYRMYVYGISVGTGQELCIRVGSRVIARQDRVESGNDSGRVKITHTPSM